MMRTLHVGERRGGQRMTLHFFCLHCPTHGPTTAGEAGAAAKHKDATGHGVSLTTDAAWAERVAERAAVGK